MKIIEEVCLVMPSYNRYDALVHQINTYTDYIEKMYIVSSFDKEIHTKVKKKLDKLVSTYPQDILDMYAYDNRKHVSWARARAMTMATHDKDHYKYVLMVDDDITVTKETVEQMKEFMDNHEEYGIVQAYGFGFFNENPLRKMRIGEYIDNTYGCLLRAIMIRDKVIDKIGYHDVNLLFREDHDYSIRTCCAGFKMAILKTDKVKVHKKFEKTGGFESPGFSDVRKQHLINSAHMLVDKYPFCKVSANGNFLAKNNLMNLSEDEREHYAYYHGSVQG